MAIIDLKSSFLPGTLLLAHFLMPAWLSSAETLSDVDREIQAEPTIKSDRDGLDAWNIYEGVTDSRLHRKIAILAGAGIHPRFYQTADGHRDYTNFYSFTSTIGFTDTKLDVVTTASSLRLYRRGDSDYKEGGGYLGSWWSDRYRGIQESRDQLAILEAWGSDLQRIYVVDVPAGYTLVGGLAAPMAKDGEYRNGGGYQYYYRGAPAGWLAYALYAPDYLKSYSGAVTGAQEAGRGIAADLMTHLDQTRHDGPGRQAGSHAPSGELWLRTFGGDLDYSDGGNVNSLTAGMSLGWQRVVDGLSSDEASSSLGLLIGQGFNFQQYGVSGVENRASATVGGVYGLYTRSPEDALSWHTGLALLYGGLNFDNSVPGELGRGLEQEYDGRIFVLAVENGICFSRQDGWSLEPQLQFLHARVYQDSFHDHLGAEIALAQGDSYHGSLGLELRKRETGDNRLDLWSRVRYVHDFSEANAVRVSGDLAESKAPQNFYGIAAGAGWKFNERWSLQCQLEEVFGDKNGLQGSLTMTYNWL